MTVQRGGWDWFQEAGLDTSGNVKTNAAGETVVNITLGDAISGERNADSATNSYLVTHGESNYTVVDEADGTAIAISSGAPAFLEGVYINEVLAGATIILEDGAGNAVITIPAGGEADVGSQLTFPSIRFNTSIVCNCEAGLSTGNITIQWRPIG
jgi:hypothetical protein